MATILFAGGGTGGHLFPAIAVAERLPGHLRAHFACSNRAIDERILGEAGVVFTPLSVRPLPRRPWHVPGFVREYLRSRRRCLSLIDEHDVKAVVSMGGFVSAPAVSAAERRGVPTILVNLDAVPGVANRFLVRRVDHIFSVHPTARLPERTRPIAMPLRRASLAEGEPEACRAALELDPRRPVLLVTGASQGAESINKLMLELIRRPQVRDALADWSILHLAGHERDEAIREAYAAAGVRGRVLAFTQQMGLAWGAADLAISRAGANSVAEAGANAVPTVFLPYPYHRDQHQKHNAAALAEAGGAVLAEDKIDAVANADRLEGVLMELLGDAERRKEMRAILRGRGGGDGAKELVEVIEEVVGR